MAVAVAFGPIARSSVPPMRAAAALRKLQEECGLRAVGDPIELSTEDLILLDGRGGDSHVIATVFRIDVAADVQVMLDAQNEAAEWKKPDQWLQAGLHAYLEKLLRLV